MHLISPARSTPLGSERSHFAHSPHLLAALILLIPPEIGGELKRKARSPGCGRGFCALGPPGRRAGPLASQPVGASGDPARRDPGGPGSLHLFRGCGQFWRRVPGRAHPPQVRGPQARPRSVPDAPGRWGRRGCSTDAPRLADGRALGPAALGVQPPGLKRRIPPRPGAVSAPTRCHSPTPFSPRDLPSVNPSLT